MHLAFLGKTHVRLFLWNASSNCLQIFRILAWDFLPKMGMGSSMSTPIPKVMLISPLAAAGEERWFQVDTHTESQTIIMHSAMRGAPLSMYITYNLVDVIECIIICVKIEIVNGKRKTFSPPPINMAKKNRFPPILIPQKCPLCNCPPPVHNYWMVPYLLST